MISPKKQDQLLRRSVKSLAVEAAREWVEESEVLMRYMLDHPDYKRKLQGRRRRIADNIRDLFSRQRDGGPPKIRQKYRREASMASIALKNKHELERRYVDGEGRLRKNPAGSLKGMARVYRANPEPEAKEAVESNEASPQDRFENLAERIMALPEAAIEAAQGGGKMILAAGRRQNGDGGGRGFNFMVEYLPVWEHDPWVELHAITVGDQVSQQLTDQPDRTFTNHSMVTADMLDRGPAIAIALHLDKMEETVASIEPTPS